MKKRWTLILSGATAATLLAGAMLALGPVVDAFAATDETAIIDQAGSATAQPGSPDAHARLERYLQREQKAFDAQTDRLQRLQNISAKAQSLIDKAKANGLDVTPLQNALSAFNDLVSQAQTAHNQAGSLLQNPAGFSGGKVVDVAMARATVFSIRQSLRDAHADIVQAVKTLRSAVREWRAAHKPGAAQTATPTP